MKATRIASRLPVGLGFLAISGALFFRATEFYSAPWGWLALISWIFLALSTPWIVSALRPWNVWDLRILAWLTGVLGFPGIMIVAAMLASAHHAGDFTAHAVVRTGAVVAVENNMGTDYNGTTVTWHSDVSLALTRPVAGQQAVVLQLPYRPDYGFGDYVEVLVDPRHPSDVELPGHQGWATTGQVLGWIEAVAVIGVALLAPAIAIVGGPDSDGRRPDFLEATLRSWAQWRAEPQDFVPWTGAVRAVAWLPFFAITTLVVYAIVDWSQWWLFLLPGVLDAVGIAAAAARRSFPRLRDAAVPLASLSVATAALVLLITGTLPPAVGVPLTASAWLIGVIAVSAPDQRELVYAAT